MNRYKCMRCNHSWTPRIYRYDNMKPKKCPSCVSDKWDNPSSPYRTNCQGICNKFLGQIPRKHKRGYSDSYDKRVVKALRQISMENKQDYYHCQKCEIYMFKTLTLRTESSVIVCPCCYGRVRLDARYPEHEVKRVRY